LLEEMSSTLPIKYILHYCLLASEFKKLTAWDTRWWLGWQLSQSCLCPACPEERLGICWDLISFPHSASELCPGLLP